MLTLNTQFLIFIIINGLGIIPVLSQNNNPDPSSFNYKWGVGVKLSPGAISIKRYFNNNKAIELIAGKHNPKYYNNYYYKHHLSLQNQGYTFAGNDDFSYPLSIQLHYLIYKDSYIFKGLRWYYGIGAQFRTSSCDYNYSFNDGSNVFYLRERVRNTGIGVDGIAGLEYSFRNIPLTVFYDINIYAEAFRHPLYMKLQASLGCRYNLN